MRNGMSIKLSREERSMKCQDTATVKNHHARRNAHDSGTVVRDNHPAALLEAPQQA